MFRSLLRAAAIEMAPPRYLLPPAAGIDISASGIKAVSLKETRHGLQIDSIAEERLPPGIVQGNEITDPKMVVDALKRLAKCCGLRYANVTLPESRGYLFETAVPGESKSQWRTGVEGHLDEHVPLPPAEVSYDIAKLGTTGSATRIVGIGYARRVVETTLQFFTDAGITVRAIEAEVFSLPRAVLPTGDAETVLIVDIGKATTKLLVVSRRMPRFATTLDVGGHALTLAVQKHFGVTEEEAKRVKVERGLMPGEENQEYLSAMLSTVSVIRDEIMHRMDYWQTRATNLGTHEPVTRAVLVGGNATLRGLPEYLEASLRIPVTLGDVFQNFASRDHWLPPLDYSESLAYGTAVGLALRDYGR